MPGSGQGAVASSGPNRGGVKIKNVNDRVRWQVQDQIKEKLK